jgi:micrococcal nuclease
MKYPALLPVLILAALPIGTLLSGALSAHAADFKGRVIAVEEGARLRVQTATKTVVVQLTCLDAPDLKQSPFGEGSINQIKALLRRNPNVSIVETGFADKATGLITGEVLVNDSSLNLAALIVGAAVIAEASPKRSISHPECDRPRLAEKAAERVAKKARSGFWKQNCPIMPWEFRRGLTKALVCGETIVYVPGSCQDLRERGINGPFYRDEKDVNYRLSRDTNRNGIGCEGTYMERTSGPTPRFQ